MSVSAQAGTPKVDARAIAWSMDRAYADEAAVFGERLTGILSTRRTMRGARTWRVGA